MDKPEAWRFLLETFPELEATIMSEVMNGTNPKADARILSAIVAAEDVIDPCQADPYDGCLADDVPVRFAVRNDAEIDRVARLNRAAPDLLNALRLMLDVIHDDMTHAQQRFRADELGVARAAIQKAGC